MDPMKTDLERIAELEGKVELLGNFAAVSIHRHEEMEEAYAEVSLLAVKLTERIAALYAKVLRLEGLDSEADEVDRVTENFKTKNKEFDLGNDGPDLDHRRPEWFK